MLGPVRCQYCDESLDIDEMLDHMPQCRVRMAALDAEVTLGRILTDEEIEEIRERLS